MLARDEAEVLKASLLAAGEEARAVVDIVAPAILSIGARTLEEIALSVLGAVVARKRLPSKDPQSAAGAERTLIAATTAPAASSSCFGGTKTAVAGADAAPAAMAAPSAKSCSGGS